MDVSNNRINISKNLEIINLTANIENPKYSLYMMRVPDEIIYLELNTELTSIVVINGELSVNDSGSVFKRFQGVHILESENYIELNGNGNCVILIGSTNNLEIKSPKKDSQKVENENIKQMSNYKVKKPWGYEVWFTQNIDNFPYALKNIHMEEGFQSSLQSHEFKSETNFVVTGEAKVLYGKEAPKNLEEVVDVNQLQSKIYKPTQGWSNKVNELHRVIAHTTYDAIEISTPELDDVVRWADDNNRKSGRIDSEHSS
tara:strand:- start:71 stop:844 length:774 start_codon:yes stop_codon:yes gene_type:complete